METLSVSCLQSYLMSKTNVEFCLSSQSSNSNLNVIVTTSVCIDAPGLLLVCHWGPAKGVEEYVQESWIRRHCYTFFKQ